MSKWLFYFAVLFIGTTFSCHKEEACIFNQVYPNEYKEFLPYNKKEKIFFKNQAGQTDTLIVNELDSSIFVMFAKDCPYNTEKITCEIQTNWTNPETLKSNHQLIFEDVILTRGTLSVTTSHNDFQATNFGGPSSGGNIEQSETIQFSGTTFNDVLLANCLSDQECPFVDSIGFAKGKGLVFYVLNGEPWVLVE